MRLKLVDVFLAQKSEAECCKIEGPVNMENSVAACWFLAARKLESYLLSALIDGVGAQQRTEHNRSVWVLYSSPEDLMPTEAYICRFERF